MKGLMVALTVAVVTVLAAPGSLEAQTTAPCCQKVCVADPVDGIPDSRQCNFFDPTKNAGCTQVLAGGPQPQVLACQGGWNSPGGGGCGCVAAIGSPFPSLRCTRDGTLINDNTDFSCAVEASRRCQQGGNAILIEDDPDCLP